MQLAISLNVTTVVLNSIILGMMVSSTLVRLEHTEIGYIQYPISIGVLVAINLAIQLVTLGKRLETRQ